MNIINRAEQVKMRKLKARVNSLESENKKLKKDLLMQRVKRGDRAIRIQR